MQSVRQHIMHNAVGKKDTPPDQQRITSTQVRMFINILGAMRNIMRLCGVSSRGRLLRRFYTTVPSVSPVSNPIVVGTSSSSVAALSSLVKRQRSEGLLWSTEVIGDHCQHWFVSATVPDEDTTRYVGLDDSSSDVFHCDTPEVLHQMYFMDTPEEPNGPKAGCSSDVLVLCWEFSS